MKIAIRNLLRNGIYSVVNITGLAVSLCVAILILLWVNDELNYDRFHTKGRDIYVAMVSLNLNGQDMAWKATSPPLGGYAQNEIPDVVSFCRIMGRGYTTFSYEEKETAQILRQYVDSSFFSIFSFKLLAGDPAHPLPDKNSVILSKKGAESLFGHYEEALGQMIREDNRNFYVSGVMEDMRNNTDLRCDALCSIEWIRDAGSRNFNHWGSLSLQTFFLLHPGADYGEVGHRLTDLHNQNFPEFAMVYTLQPLFKNRFYDEHNRPNSNMQACKLFSLAVLVLLLIACINYVNLVTARMVRRNKELYVKKALGSGKWKLFFQSMQESTLLLLLSIIIATVLVVSLFSLFRAISGKEMELQLFSIGTMMVYLITLVTVTLFSGLFPAVKLAAFQTSDLAAKANSKSGGVWLRRVLVVLQFSAAIMLVTSSMVLSQQMRYLQQKDLGYDRENVMEIPLRGNMISGRQAIQNDLLQQSGVLGVTFASQSIQNAGIASGWKDSLLIVFVHIDKAFIPAMGMELVQGDNFSDMPADSAHFILNQTAVKAIGMRDPVGRSFEFQDIDGTIIGVVKDFNFKDLHVSIEPLVFQYGGDPALMYVRVAPGAGQSVVTEIEKIIHRHNPSSAFNYTFLSDSFERMYRSDIRTGKLFSIFAIIAVWVSCLGLFGMVTYTAEVKIKEIGIRKVLGASVLSTLFMLLKEFLILVGTAMLIAFPLAYYWLDRMLQDFAYRISIGWSLFALAGLVTLIVTLLTVSWQAIRAATANPVTSIKSE